MKLRIATRKSKLALWQANYVADRLRFKGAEVEIVALETKGDKVLDVTLAKIGSKGVFTEELESLLRSGEVHMAVHSAKDLQSTLPVGFMIAAFSEREEAHDVLVSPYDIDIHSKIVLGTASTRRMAFMHKYLPEATAVTVRGNLQTRFEKMTDGACDALWLAYAGVKRMEMEQYIIHQFPVDPFVPPVGQGAIAVEVCSDLEKPILELIRSAVNHEATETCLLAERAFLKKLEGGCSIPAFAYAHWKEKMVHLKGGLMSLNGSKEIGFEEVVEPSKVEMAGVAIAEKILAAGGAELLKEIREDIES